MSIKTLPVAIKAKPPRKPRLKEVGQPWNPLLDHFHPSDHSLTKGLLEELKQCQEDDSHILWYPSAGADLTDLNQIHRLYGKAASRPISIPPKIFVHTDQREDVFGVPSLPYQELLFQNTWKSHLQKIISNDELQWLICINIDNYDFLMAALARNLHIQYLYTTCDGVTSGMGGYPKFYISTFYLTQFYRELGVKYHITEYSKEYYESEAPRISENLETQVPHLLDKYPEIDGMNTPLSPQSFINLREEPIGFCSANGNPLVIRYCQS